jgi:hypothetical protein
MDLKKTSASKSKSVAKPVNTITIKFKSYDSYASVCTDGVIGNAWGIYFNSPAYMDPFQKPYVLQCQYAGKNKDIGSIWFTVGFSDRNEWVFAYREAKSVLRNEIPDVYTSTANR